MENIEEHIQRLSETLSSIKKDLPGGLRHRRTNYAADYDASEEGQDTPPKLRSYDYPAVIGDAPLTTPSRGLHVVKKSKPAGTMARSPLKTTCYNSN